MAGEDHEYRSLSTNWPASYYQSPEAKEMDLPWSRPSNA
jgi:hypothetical protein